MFNTLVKSNHTKLVVFLVACVLTFIFSLPAIAANGPTLQGVFLTTVSGNTSNTGANVNQSADIPVDSIFELVFDKNITNDSVYQNNQANISLKTMSGSTVTATVFRLGNGSNTDPKKDSIFLKPTSRLTTDQQYQIVISSGIKGNNGQTLASQQIVVFTTSTSTNTATNSTATTTPSNNSAQGYLPKISKYIYYLIPLGLLVVGAGIFALKRKQRI